jgi:AcrR family transcriptional regulator
MPGRKPQASDITAYARIRNAALKLFGEQGAAATSVRTIAKAAGVSPGLVQHHFKTKAELQASLEGYVVEKVVELAKICMAQSDHPGEFVIGRLIADFVRSNADGIHYARRVMLEDGALGHRLFDQVILSCRLLMEQFVRDGILRKGLDMEWASFNATLMIVGPVLFESVVNRHLDRPLRTDEGMARWDAACDDLWGHGYYSAETQKARKSKASKQARPVRRKTKAKARAKLSH